MIELDQFKQDLASCEQPLKEVRDSLEKSYFDNQQAIEKRALELYLQGEDVAVNYLTDYSNETAQQMLARWRQLATYLIVKYNDMAVKPEKDGKFERTSTGQGARVQRTGYSDKFKRQIAKYHGERFAEPK